jgi:hypothetical protein
MKTVIPAPPAFNFQYRGTLTKFSAVDVVRLRSLRERKKRHSGTLPSAALPAEE